MGKHKKQIFPQNLPRVRHSVFVLISCADLVKVDLATIFDEVLVYWPLSYSQYSVSYDFTEPLTVLGVVGGFSVKSVRNNPCPC